MDEIKLHEKLTPRERSVVKAVAEGYRNKEIGARLGLTENTVKAYLSRIYVKTSANNRLQLALLVIAEGA
jgi:DNA-binding NarL/FixJ family response regulator